MAEFGQLIITDKGSSLIMKTMKSNEKIGFTGLATSVRRYHEEELKGLSDLGDMQQRSDISGIDIEGNSTIMIHAVMPNTELTDGYYIKTIGLYADDPDEGEILYAVSAETSDSGCYVPPYNHHTVSNLYFNLSVAVGNSENVQLEVDPGAIVTIKQLGAAEQRIVDMVYQQSTGYTDQQIAKLINGAPSTLDTLGEIADAMSDNQDVVEALNAAIGSKANQAEVESLLGTKLEKTGDSKDNEVTFSSSDVSTPSAWTDVDVLKSGETHKSIFAKISTMFKNMRYLRKLLGSTDISTIADGTVTGALNQLNTGISIRYNNDTGYLAFRDPASGEWVDSYIQLSEFYKFNALETSSGDWTQSGKGNVALSKSSLRITFAGEYEAGDKGSYTYKKSIKVSNRQTISLNATFGGNLYVNSILKIYYKIDNASSWTLLKILDGSVDGANIAYRSTVPVSGNVNIYIAYGVSGYNCPIDINITKFTIE